MIVLGWFDINVRMISYIIYLNIQKLDFLNIKDLIKHQLEILKSLGGFYDGLPPPLTGFIRIYISFLSLPRRIAMYHPLI